MLKSAATWRTFLKLLAASVVIVLTAACTSIGPKEPIERQAPAPVAVGVAPMSPGDTRAVSAPTAAAATSRSDPASLLANGGAAGPAVDPLRPEVIVNLEDQVAEEAARRDLWVRLRRGFSMPDLENDLVVKREQWYAAQPAYVQRMTTRGGRYLFHIVEELERRDMPSELALLPFIESAFNPEALSSAKASGMWQFMPATGKYFDLKQNIFRDDRRDVLASTRAALDYLQKLYGMFDDWHLALAAYNWGEGSVQRAIARNQKAGLPTDYASLKMPLETQHYVPKFQAIKNIIARPEAFGLSLPPLENHPYFLAIPIERDMDVELAARLSGLPLAEFKSLNPQMNKPVILAAGTPQLLLPYDNASEFVRRLRAHQGPLASWTAWVTPKTMRLEEAAKKVGMDESHLREVNRIPPRMLVKAGSTLLVTRGAHTTLDVSERVADNASMSLSAEAPAQRRVTFKAAPKDTVTSIAKRYKVSAAQVAQWNGISISARLKAGQALVVFVPNKATTRSRKSASQTASSTRSPKLSARQSAAPSARKKVSSSATRAKH